MLFLKIIQTSRFLLEFGHFPFLSFATQTRDQSKIPKRFQMKHLRFHYTLSSEGDA